MGLPVGKHIVPDKPLPANDELVWDNGTSFPEPCIDRIADTVGTQPTACTPLQPLPSAGRLPPATMPRARPPAMGAATMRFIATLLHLVTPDDAAVNAGIPPSGPEPFIRLDASKPEDWDGAAVQRRLSGRGPVILLGKTTEGGTILRSTSKPPGTPGSFTADKDAALGFLTANTHTVARPRNPAKAIYNDPPDFVSGDGDIRFHMTPKTAGKVTARPCVYSISPPNDPAFQTLLDWIALKEREAAGGTADPGDAVLQLESLEIYLMRDFIAHVTDFRADTAAMPLFSFERFEKTMRRLSCPILPKNRSRLNIALVGEAGSGKSTLASRLYALFNPAIRHVCPSGVALAPGTSLTTRLQMVPINAAGQFTGLNLIDMAGYEGTPASLTHTANMTKHIINGHLGDGYDLRQGQPEGSGAPGFRGTVTPDDAVDALGLVVSFQRFSESSDASVALTTAIRQIVETSHAHMRTQLVVLMSMPERLVPALLAEPWRLFEDASLKEQMSNFSAATGVPTDRIIPVASYSQLEEKGYEYKVSLANALEVLYNAAMCRAECLAMAQQARRASQARP